jgi:hypothetical protein
MMDDLKQAKINSRKIKKDGELYEFVGEFNKLIPIDILDKDINGRKVREYLSDLELATKQLEESSKFIENVLLDHGYYKSADSLPQLLEQLSKVLIIDPNKEYVAVEVNDSGYINDGSKIKGRIIKAESLPSNYDNGCYKIVNHELKLDEKKLKEKILLS